jgi:hypothetical protein
MDKRDFTCKKEHGAKYHTKEQTVQTREEEKLEKQYSIRKHKCFQRRSDIIFI